MDADADMRSRPEENLFRRRCIILCDSPAPTECMPDICRAIRLRTAVFACRNSSRSRSSMQSVSALRSPCSGGRQPGAISGQSRPMFQRSPIDLQSRASIQDLLRLRRLGGGGKSLNFPVARRVASSRYGCHTEQRKRRREWCCVLWPLFGRGLINTIRAGGLRSVREIDKSARIFSASSRSGSIAGSLLSSSAPPAPPIKSVSASGAASGSTFGSSAILLSPRPISRDT